MSYFNKIRKNVIGNEASFESPYGTQRILYADWTASGRMYQPIEDLLTNEIYPFVGNTHTETSITGSLMTHAYHRAKEIIKTHVNTSDEDIIISSNAGMTGVVNKFQRILGLKIHEKYTSRIQLENSDKPVIFVTHMEHHSNHTSWYETVCDVEVINATKEGLISMEHLAELIEKYKDRRVKIASVTSCSNVTGIITPYHQIAGIMHSVGGYCFVDFAASAPYIDIDMHPEDREDEYLDAIFFSPHKFLGGPASTGILIFNQNLYSNRVPDNPGGGTVQFTNPWGEHAYIEEIEAREDGGTPAFLQTIRVALAVQLKEDMGVDRMMQREEEMAKIVWDSFDKLPNIHVLADNLRERLCIFSFFIESCHYNLAVRLLNDKYGIQTRGGCSCAGTYGHYLLEVSHEISNRISGHILVGDLSDKPGWIRMSLHPLMTDEEVRFIMNAIKEVAENHKEWANDYLYNQRTNEFIHKNGTDTEEKLVESWYKKL